MKKKQDLPLVILKALEPFVNLKDEKFEVHDPKESLLKVVGKGNNSVFYFIIERYKKSSGNTFEFFMKRSPRNLNENGLYETWLDVKTLAERFDGWIKLLDEYDNVKSFYDDPIIQSFSEGFLEQFDIIDEDANIKPFNINQILFLDEHLSEMSLQIAEFTSGQNSIQIEEIKNDILILRNSLTNKSKKIVIKGLTIIWAKMAKLGTRFIVEFLTDSKIIKLRESVFGKVLKKIS